MRAVRRLVRLEGEARALFCRIDPRYPNLEDLRGHVQLLTQTPVFFLSGELPVIERNGPDHVRVLVRCREQRVGERPEAADGGDQHEGRPPQPAPARPERTERRRPPRGNATLGHGALMLEGRRVGGGHRHVETRVHDQVRESVAPRSGCKHTTAPRDQSSLTSCHWIGRCSLRKPNSLLAVLAPSF